MRLNLFGAALSRGKDVEVQLAEVEGLRVNVLRLADGTTNLERLARAAAPAEPSPDPDTGGAGAGPVVPSRRPGQRLGGTRRLARPHARRRQGDLRRPHRRHPQGPPVGPAAGRGLARRPARERRNLELHLHAAPLPPTLRPTLDHVTLKLEPVDLDPLAPFFPASAGFLGGRLEVDLDAALGAAVPEGTGPTRLRGGFAARALRFAGQEGGKPLDVVLEADLDGDVARGDVRIGKLLLTAGPATLSGSGGASGLAGGSPRIEGLRLSVQGLDPRLLAAYYPPMRRSVGDRIAGPIGIELRAAGDAASPALEARADLTPVRLAFPGTLAKAPGAPLVAMARASFAGGTTHVAARVDLSGVDLRPGGSVAKAPGDRLAVEADVERRVAGKSQAIDVKRLQLLLPGDAALSAHGTASIAEEKGARAVRFELAAESAQLDLDRLLIPSRARREEGGAGPSRRRRERRSRRRGRRGRRGRRLHLRMRSRGSPVRRR